MSKAILIVDEPESIDGEVPCIHCQLFVREYDDYYKHFVCQNVKITYGDIWEVYKNCPLMQLRDNETLKCCCDRKGD